MKAIVQIHYATKTSLDRITWNPAPIERIVWEVKQGVIVDGFDVWEWASDKFGSNHEIDRGIEFVRMRMVRVVVKDGDKIAQRYVKNWNHQ